VPIEQFGRPRRGPRDPRRAPRPPKPKKPKGITPKDFAKGIEKGRFKSFSSFAPKVPSKDTREWLAKIKVIKKLSKGWFVAVPDRFGDDWTPAIIDKVRQENPVAGFPAATIFFRIPNARMKESDKFSTFFLATRDPRLSSSVAAINRLLTGGTRAFNSSARQLEKKEPDLFKEVQKIAGVEDMSNESTQIPASLKADVKNMKAFQMSGELNMANHYYANVTREAARLGLTVKQVLDRAEDTPKPAGT